MPDNQNVYFNIDDFLSKLDKQDYTPEQVAELVREEIRRMERLKVNLLGELNTQPEAVILLTNEIDTYRFRLQEILSQIPLDTPEKRFINSDEMQKLRARMEKILKKLEG
jgi:hypothetical protein